jgi:sirohydrochlorin cobaltochelatase
MPDIGVLICGHGSRDARGPAELAALAGQIARRFPHWTFGHGFLEFAEPTIADGLKHLTETGVRTIIAVPALLFAARHARMDIPSVLRGAALGGLDVHYAEPLGFDPKLLRAAADRIEEAEATAPPNISRNETLLLVAGRGTTDPEANGDLAKLSRMLCEGMEFGWGETCYSGVTEPQTERALDHAAKLGYRRIIVLPYFLFTGALVERVHAATDAAARRHPGIEFIKVGHLNDHPLIIEAFSDRIIDAVEGPPHGHHGHQHDHSHEHHDDCDDEWHIHAPSGGGATKGTDVYSLAPRKRAAGR